MSRADAFLVGPIKEYDYVPACRGNGATADATGTADCASAHTCAAPTALKVFVSERVVGTTAWRRQPGTVCLTEAQRLPFDPAAAQGFVDDYFQRLPLPEPGLHLQPEQTAVVNLPEVVSADPPPGGVFVVNEPPFPQITVTASARWAWDFGDGATSATDSPGRAYDGTDPRSAGDYYVSHRYAARSGARTITATAVWTATWQMAGYPGVRVVDGEVRRSSSRAVAVGAYGAQLTDN